MVLSFRQSRVGVIDILQQGAYLSDASLVCVWIFYSFKPEVIGCTAFVSARLDEAVVCNGSTPALLLVF